MHGIPIPVERDIATRAGSQVTLGMRPEAWSVVPAGTPDTLELVVDLVEVLGSESFVYGHPLGASESDRITVKVIGRSTLDLGDTVHIRPTDEIVHFFDAQTGRSLRD